MVKDFRHEKIIKILKKYSCWTPEEHYDCISKLADELLGLFKQFQMEKLSELANEMIGEEGIKWMQEGNKKNRRGYTEGFNAKQQECIEVAKKYRLIK